MRAEVPLQTQRRARAVGLARSLALAVVALLSPAGGLGAIGAAWVASGALACAEDLSVDDVRWACERDDQCGAGWGCRQPAGASQRVCVRLATWVQPDAEPGDGASDAGGLGDGGSLDAGGDPGADGGPDVEDVGLLDVDATDSADAADAADAGDTGDDDVTPDVGGSCGACPEGFSCEQGACVTQDRVYVPGGAFAMGCNATLDGLCASFASEAPQHVVTVAPFALGRTEVTVAAYQACVTAGACAATAGDSPLCNAVGQGVDDHPVNCVTRDQAAAYCAYAGGRLCSEAEWEKAARGGCDTAPAPCLETTRTYPWGEASPTCDLAVMNDPASDTGCGAGGTMPVGSKPQGRSPYGALDMAGNVLDWVADCAHDTYEGAPADGSVWTGEPCDAGVLRGGSFEHTAPLLRAGARLVVPLGGPVSHSFGVRCCFPAP